MVIGEAELFIPNNDRPVVKLRIKLGVAIDGSVAALNPSIDVSAAGPGTRGVVALSSTYPLKLDRPPARADGQVDICSARSEEGDRLGAREEATFGANGARGTKA